MNPSMLLGANKESMILEINQDLEKESFPKSQDLGKLQTLEAMSSYFFTFQKHVVLLSPSPQSIAE